MCIEELFARYRLVKKEKRGISTIVDDDIKMPKIFRDTAGNSKK